MVKLLDIDDQVFGDSHPCVRSAVKDLELVLLDVKNWINLWFPPANFQLVDGGRFLSEVTWWKWLLTCLNSDRATDTDTMIIDGEDLVIVELTESDLVELEVLVLSETADTSIQINNLVCKIVKTGVLWLSPSHEDLMSINLTRVWVWHDLTLQVSDLIWGELTDEGISQSSFTNCVVSSDLEVVGLLCLQTLNLESSEVVWDIDVATVLSLRLKLPSVLVLDIQASVVGVWLKFKG